MLRRDLKVNSNGTDNSIKVVQLYPSASILIISKIIPSIYVNND